LYFYNWNIKLKAVFTVRNNFVLLPTLKNTIMKKFLFLLLMITVILSCNTKQPEKTVSTDDTTSFVTTTDTATINKDSHYFWSSDAESQKGLVMIKSRPLPTDSLTETNIIQILNEAYPEIPLSFIKVSNDSIFLKIKKSSYLTEQLGSTGADAYIAEVTYNLTELKGINFVDIRFKEGDHASPGTYSRTDFVQVGN
jgi:hypothetical protein